MKNSGPSHNAVLIGLVLGAAAGILVHWLGELDGVRAWVERQSADGAPHAAGYFAYHYLLLPLDTIISMTGTLFLRLLLMLVIPLVFAALALGVAGLGDLKSLGRVGLKTLAYTVVVSAIAVALGVTLVKVFSPGAGLSDETRAKLLAAAAERTTAITSAPAPKTGVDLLLQIVPDNPVRAAATGDMLAVMFFSLMIGIGLLLTRTDAARRLEEALQGLFDVGLRLIRMVIAFAPIGVGALIFTLTAKLGFELLIQLGGFVLVVLSALLLHQVVVYSLSVRLLGGTSPWRFFRGIQEAMITAFSTASSNATLPTALQVAEEKLRLPAHVSRFVLTIGATANQNGTALYEGVTVLFLAQVYGVDLTTGQQLAVVGLAVLGGIGTAGVPAGSIPILVAILGMAGVPVEGIGLVLGVDRLLDMCRTVVNVSGDLAAAVVISRGERGPRGA
ncbi:MAG: dicarboxylate/amino acid:cation symporter [Planctomycetes bacterium]|nr:dicarboxylate/amino acid:cation symporter [Planctomycetota bacterium]